MTPRRAPATGAEAPGAEPKDLYLDGTDIEAV